jgi:NAD(P)-dependent dehydrogenase (short-subunit alcohol dehydrogenase family)
MRWRWGPEVEVGPFDESFDANVRGAYFLPAAVVKGTVARGSGSIVNAVAPGPTRTQKGIDTMADAIDQLGSSTPLGRAASPSEIAEAIVFLASERASYVTGTTLAVDGGRTAV